MYQPLIFSRLQLAIIIVTFFCLLNVTYVKADTDDNAVGIQVEERLEASEGAAFTIFGDRVHNPQAVRALFAENDFKPVWTENPDATEQHLEQLLEVVTLSDAHGLTPEDYHRSSLSKILLRVADEGLNSSLFADIEIIATDAFLLLADHFDNGRLDPASVDPKWLIKHSDATPARLRKAIADGSVKSALLDLLPLHSDYWQLVDKYAKLKQLRISEAAPVQKGQVLKLGVQDERVAKLRERISSMGIKLPSSDKPDYFDKEFEGVIKQCQRMFNLEDDGFVGPSTLNEINQPNEERLLQIRANLERWRWLDRDLGERHIRVNIADFKMQYVDGDQIVRKDVIVGKQFRQTPVFSGRMTYLVLNPYWNVPRSIALKDKLAKIKKDPSYLEKGHYSLLSGWDANASAVDPYSIDWETITRKNFKWRIRQNPGSHNALGQVKFMFPNDYAIYLHDTPSRELFNRTKRDFSSGCIRVHDPIALAELLLESNGGWPRQRIDKVLDRGKEATVSLKKPLPVHLLYFTTIIDPETGDIRYLSDLYKRDQKVIDAMRAAPTGKETLL